MPADRPMTPPMLGPSGTAEKSAVPAGLDADAFLAAYPRYEQTRVLDQLRATEYGYLDERDDVYLDYTGAGLAARAQFRAHETRLSRACYGNPHSENPTSRAANELVDSARQAVLEFVNASPDEYAAIFTPNATGACRLIGEAYPFRRGRRLVLTSDSHNSVNGIREYARRGHARTLYVPVVGPDLRIDGHALTAALSRRGNGRRGLFAYPAQSNFTGVQHSLDWVEVAHEHGYDVLLDVAAYLPANRLDLQAVRPDFVTVSWYKVFGYPTGVGCLIARREALARLRRPWFSGGTIMAVSTLADWHLLMDDETAFEDGTLNFLSLPDVEFGLSWISNIGVEVIQSRVRCLTGWLLDRFRAMRHSNCAPMVRVYGPTDVHERGGIVAFNFLDPDGTPVDERLVAKETAASGFSVRTGCFCNPGAGEGAFAITRRSLRHAPRWGIRTVDDYLELLSLPTGGAVRVSFGLASTYADAERFLRFAEATYRDRRIDTTGLPPRLRC
jgi:selenocysteine lyase/cysteine desulfurase